MYLFSPVCATYPLRLDLVTRQARVQIWKLLLQFSLVLRCFVLFRVSFSLGVDSEECNIEYNMSGSEGSARPLCSSVSDGNADASV